MGKSPFYHIQQFFHRIVETIGRMLGIRRRAPMQRRALRMNWVIPGKLAVGGSPQAGDSAALHNCNIKVVLSLCANSEEPLPEDVQQEFRCLRLVLPDSHYKTEIKPSQLAAAIDIIHHSIANHLPIYVHCLAGVERSPTVCIAYLCCHQKLELWEAVHWLKQVHPFSMPTESQLRAVRHLLKQYPYPQTNSTIQTQ